MASFLLVEKQGLLNVGPPDQFPAHSKADRVDSRVCIDAEAYWKNEISENKTQKKKIRLRTKHKHWELLTIPDYHRPFSVSLTIKGNRTLKRKSA